MRPPRHPACHLVVMARLPRLGRVKTRLAGDVGALAALRFYRQQTAALLGRLGRDPRWRTWLALTPEAAARRAAPPWRFRGATIGQGGGDLGQRMARLIRVLPPGPVVIVGSDIPDIKATHIAQAFAALGGHDWVFGPARDGGYWLVGAKRRPRVGDPFVGVRWSTASALADTLGNLDRARVALLEELDDIDRGEDLARWRRREGARS